MTFIFKKFISQFLMPVPLIAEFFLVGCLLSRSVRLRLLGRCFKGASMVLFLVFGYGVGADWYVYNLERRYRPIFAEDYMGDHLRGAAIVVLGQGMPSDSDLPLRMQITASFVRRLQEGAHLNRMIPDSNMYVSLAGEVEAAKKNRLLDEFADQNALVRSRVRLISVARDTADEARIVIDLIGTNRIVLVTSAVHMPRAVKIFRAECERRKIHSALYDSKNGIALTPAPCDFSLTCKPDLFVPRKLWVLPLPSADGFCRSQYALYEGLGNIYERLFGERSGL